ARESGQPKLAANWVMGELSAALNRDELAVEQCPVPAAALARLLARIQDGTISGKIAREVFAAMWAAGREGSVVADDAADRIIDERGLRQISDSGELERLVDQVIAANPKSVEEFRAGKEKAFNALVGQLMKATKGKANPQQAGELLRRRLAG
ncbi:MAG TPA: Asp-tRNA(Asn)/Glu-tRNA(Gln) amidotransferase GatCAB subunit B, partial [Burkholderiaceae bacterium]|nr:Asp-tRNA(Asn)/Glu-tRNA(Gln) amidotransferase GatCAB subunit B [Burkholderiaceae bacterium]